MPTAYMSLVIAVISLLGVIASAIIGAVVTWIIERAKRDSDARKLLSKYQDPLLLAAKDLQSRLHNLLEGRVLENYKAPKEPEEEEEEQRVQRVRDFQAVRALVAKYTLFLIGQYFSWTYILRRQAQFLRFSTDQSSNAKLIRLLDDIQWVFSDSQHEEYDKDEKLFSLWRGQQMAIGEIMTITSEDQDKQQVCMGYAEFSKRFQDEYEASNFKDWFAPILKDIDALGNEWVSSDGKHRQPAPRLHRLQHLLIDLMNLLDRQGLSSQSHKLQRVKAARFCICGPCKRAGNSRPRRRKTPRGCACTRPTATTPLISPV